MFYLFFMSLHTIYSIWIAFSGNDLGKDTFSSICLTFLLLTLMAMAMFLLYQELTQMKTYIHDGRTLFPNDRMWGFRKYWSSPWNVAEVSTYVITMVIVPSLHIAKLCEANVLPFLYIFIALDTCLIWIKVSCMSSVCLTLY